MLVRNQKGQALIELIIFLPMIMMMYAIISGFANAINGSINQQKITRSYLYYRVQNNSTIPKPDQEKTYSSWRTFGLYMIGWREKFNSGDNPVLPCYRLTIPLSPGDNDNCEDSYSKPSTFFIRVGTVHGLCGATYGNNNGAVSHLPDNINSSYKQVVDEGSCIITQ